jgi:hypothetical protein
MSRAPFTLTIVAVLMAGAALALYGPGPDAPALLVANKNGASLYLVNPASGQVTDSVSTGAGPHEVAAAPGHAPRLRGQLRRWDNLGDRH